MKGSPTLPGLAVQHNSLHPEENDMTEPDVLVLAHGAFHGPWCWHPTMQVLEKKGLRCVAVDLNRGGLEADRDALQAVVDALRTEEGCRVHAIGHSLGCASVQALDAGTLASAMLLAGAVGAAPGMPHQGEMLAGDFLSKLIPQDDGRAFVSREDAKEMFYGGCKPEEAEWALDRLRPTFVYGSDSSDPIFWEALPVTYIACERDQAVDPAYQHQVVEQMRYGTVLDSDHSPMIGQPELLADAILEAMAKAD